MVGAVSQDGHIWLLVPRSDYEIVDTWFVSGLKGTGSKDIVIKDAFVPQHRIVNRDRAGDQDLTGWEIHQSSRYRMPLAVLLGWDLVAPMLGIAVGLVLMATTAAAQLPLWAFVGSFVVVALSQSFMGGSMQTIASDLAPPRSRGQFLGVSRLVGEGGSLGNPGSFAAITTLLGGSVGFAAAFAFTAAAALATAILVGVGLQETLQKEARPRI